MIKIKNTNYDVTVGTGSTKEGTRETKVTNVDVADFPEVALEKIFSYGFQRYINDGCGGSDKTLADKVKHVEETIARLKEGIIAKTRSSSGKPAYWSFVRKIVRGKLTGKNKEGLDKLHEASERNEYIDELFEGLKEDAQAKIVEVAEALYAEAQKRKAAEQAATSGFDVEL